MPRSRRTELADAIHHVWQRGNNRRAVFIDDEDRQLFLRLLAGAVRKYGWRCLSYCLMPNHFHLVVETPSPTLGVGMRDFSSRYAQLFNERHDTGGGHLFQARFGSKIVRSDEQLAQLLRYVARNPVRAGLAADPASWPWSSHLAIVNQRPHPLVDVVRVNEVLEAFGGDARRRYLELFEPEGPLSHLDADLSPWRLRPSLGAIFASDDLPAAARSARRNGYRLADIAAHTGVSEATVSRWMKRAA